jgi:hypothetical protein
MTAVSQIPRSSAASHLRFRSRPSRNGPLCTLCEYPVSDPAQLLCAQCSSYNHLNHAVARFHANLRAQLPRPSRVRAEKEYGR